MQSNMSPHFTPKAAWRIKPTKKPNNQKRQVEKFQQLKFTNKPDWKVLKKSRSSAAKKNQFLFVDLSPKADTSNKENKLQSPCTLNNGYEFNPYPSPTESRFADSPPKCVFQNGQVVLSSSFSPIQNHQVNCSFEDEDECHDAKAAFAKIVGKSLSSLESSINSPVIKKRSKSTDNLSYGSRISKPMVRNSKSFSSASFDLSRLVLPSSTPNRSSSKENTTFSETPCTPLPANTLGATAQFAAAGVNHPAARNSSLLSSISVGSPIQLGDFKQFTDTTFADVGGLKTPTSSPAAAQQIDFQHQPQFENQSFEETPITTSMIAPNTSFEFNNFSNAIGNSMMGVPMTTTPITGIGSIMGSPSKVRSEILNFSDDFFQLQMGQIGQKIGDLGFDLFGYGF
ncbi:hypothetical protein DASC09_043970 [Saccharomycopsis crataegensis]|uniref:Uncharacterized protein n=1 Tax=Saccharomycopsis crataegensis TaxID=43959 RepID=A0AAV5QRI4_9ASCO|nr:hypothetical protein DASC09_043970 [Saccharomycopsis crataegensis]